LNLNLRSFGGSTLLPVHVENRVCLSCGVQVIGATWRVAMRIMAGVGDLVQRTGDGQAQVGYSVAEDTVCGLHSAQGDKEHGFLGLASKLRSMISSSLAVSSGFPVWTSKWAATV
jgi:hypothetical protein